MLNFSFLSLLCFPFFLNYRTVKKSIVLNKNLNKFLKKATKIYVFITWLWKNIVLNKNFNKFLKKATKSYVLWGVASVQDGGVSWRHATLLSSQLWQPLQVKAYSTPSSRYEGATACPACWAIKCAVAWRSSVRWLGDQVCSGWAIKFAVAELSSVLWLGDQVSGGWVIKCAVAVRSSVRWLGDQVCGGWAIKCAVAERSSVLWLGDQVGGGWVIKCAVAGRSSVL